eukprot:28628_1
MASQPKTHRGQCVRWLPKGYGFIRVFGHGFPDHVFVHMNAIAPMTSLIEGSIVSLQITIQSDGRLRASKCWVQQTVVHGVWQYQDDNGNWVNMTPTINKVLDNSSNSGAHSCCYSVGQWRYRYIPTTNTTGFQHNVKTNRRRRLRKVTKPSSPIIQKNLKKVQRNGYICNGRGRGYAAFRTNYASRGSSRGRGYSGSRGSSKGNGIRTTGRYHGPPALSTGYQRYRSFRARGGHPSQRMSATSSSVPRKND